MIPHHNKGRFGIASKIKTHKVPGEKHGDRDYIHPNKVFVVNQASIELAHHHSQVVPAIHLVVMRFWNKAQHLFYHALTLSLAQLSPAWNCAITNLEGSDVIG